MSDVLEFVNQTPDCWVQDAIFKAHNHIQDHERIVCAVSGGSDSDIMLDLLYKLDDDKKITYVWCDTGLEYEATKRHLSELEEKYNIEIVRLKTKYPIPYVVRKHGVPFINKYVSDMIHRLQLHNFQWEDGTFEELYEKYPRCKSALKWWCNANGEGSRFNISRNSWLKEFMMENPPDFEISPRCCEFAKKSVLNEYVASGEFDLRCVGVRKSEEGARSVALKNCYTPSGGDKEAQYRPLFWFDDQSKACYKSCHGITYSDCYELWGLRRTGCAACPFGLTFEFELECIEKHEPKLFNAVNKIFGDSYEYTRKYREFRKNMKAREKTDA
jgi:3'-phosphoadenosine 5'-phosphosulfate sulfotransferase (PAPS reductase)/FAD synthetase